MALVIDRSKFRAAFRAADLTAVQVGRRTGTSEDVMWNLHGGRTRSCPDAIAHAIAEVLGVPTGDLFVLDALHGTQAEDAHTRKEVA